MLLMLIFSFSFYYHNNLWGIYWEPILNKFAVKLYEINNISYNHRFVFNFSCFVQNKLMFIYCKFLSLKLIYIIKYKKYGRHKWAIVKKGHSALN